MNIHNTRKIDSHLQAELEFSISLLPSATHRYVPVRIT